MGCTVFWVKFDRAFAYFVVSVYEPDGAIVQYKISILIASSDCAWQARENIFLHKEVSIYKVHSTLSMNRTHLFLTVNTNI